MKVMNEFPDRRTNQKKPQTKQKGTHQDIVSQQYRTAGPKIRS